MVQWHWPSMACGSKRKQVQRECGVPRCCSDCGSRLLFRWSKVHLFHELMSGGLNTWTKPRRRETRSLSEGRRDAAFSAWSTKLLRVKFQIKQERLSPGNAVPLPDTRRNPDPTMAAEPLDHRAAERPGQAWDSNAEEDTWDSCPWTQRQQSGCMSR